MKNIFLLLLLATALFWVLGQRTHTIAPGPGEPSMPVRVSLPAEARGVIGQHGPEVAMTYYAVSGNTAAALRDDMNRQRPINGFDGHTDWHVHWGWPGFGHAVCDLGAATLETTITVTLPRWHPAHDAEPALILHWNNYLGSLTRHEQGHVESARQGFQKMQAILREGKCTDADSRLNTVLGEMREADLRYDAETRHGQTQGARFP